MREKASCPIVIQSNWSTFDDVPLDPENLRRLFSNELPCVRQKAFLTAEECERLVKVIERNEIGHYNPQLIYPLVGSVGVTQFDFQDDMSKYFEAVEPARSLLRRFKDEAGIDIIGRILKVLEETLGCPARVAKEGDKEFFAGIVRCMNNIVAPHADYGPFDGPEYEIGKIFAQVSWNILLKRVPGGETMIYDRQWDGPRDDLVYKKKSPRYAYSPAVFQGHAVKVMLPIEGDLTFFNSRNFHEVKAVDEWVDKKEKETRYTVSSFVGLLPGDQGGPCVILWS